MMIKGSIHQKDIILVNIHEDSIGAPNYIKQILADLKGEIDNNSIIIGDFNTPLRTMDKAFRQKINKETLDLNYTLIK